MVKTCSCCRKVQPLTEFHKDGSRKSGLHTYCKDCYNFKKSKRRGSNVESYDYDELFKKQNGKCAICGSSDSQRKLAVDHDHATGRVRGLLCKGCNRAIGLFKDDTNIIEQAIAYLNDR